MAEEYTFLLNKSYSRESRANFPGKRENRRDPGKSGTGNPGNETHVVYNFDEPGTILTDLPGCIVFRCTGVRAPNPMEIARNGVPRKRLGCTPHIYIYTCNGVAFYN
jgi:hypothetical protein